MGIALQSHTTIAILTIKQAFLGVASFVTDVIFKDFPTRFISGGGVTMLPWVDTFTAIVSVVSAKVSVAFFVASVIASLPIAFVLKAFLLFFIEVESEAAVGRVDSSGAGLVCADTL